MPSFSHVVKTGHRPTAFNTAFHDGYIFPNQLSLYYDQPSATNEKKVDRLCQPNDATKNTNARLKTTDDQPPSLPLPVAIQQTKKGCPRHTQFECTYIPLCETPQKTRTTPPACRTPPSTPSSCGCHHRSFLLLPLPPPDLPLPPPPPPDLPFDCRACSLHRRRMLGRQAWEHGRPRAQELSP